MLIEDKIKAILKEQLDVDVTDISSTIAEDLHADSLDKIELIMSIEDAFDISISDVDAEKIITVNDLISYVKTKIHERGEK